MKKIEMVITNGGDGSNGLRWVTDPAVIDRMIELADDGDETYASGEGLQVKEFVFPDDFDLDAWIKMNKLAIMTMEKMR